MTDFISGVHCLLANGLLATRWQLTNLRYCSKTTVASLRAIVVSDQQLQTDIQLKQLFSLYARTVKIPEQQLTKYLNKKISKYGSCQGRALTIVNLVLSNPSLSCSEIITLSSRSSSQIAFLQSLEIVRGGLCCNSEIEQRQAKEVADLVQIKSIREPKSISQYDFSATTSSENSYDQFFKTLRNSSVSICVIRCWNNFQRSKAHSVVFCCSENHRHYWFFNSKSAGAFVFSNSEELTQKFFEHLKIFMSQVFKPGGMIQVEGHEIPKK